MLTAEAGVFMAILKEEGGVPEIPVGRQGNLQSGMMCDPKSEPIFPFNAHFRAIMSDAPATIYGFIVTKDVADSPWTMSQAWKETNGHKTALTLPHTDVQSKANVELLRRKEKDKTANNETQPTK